jgi:acetyl-CoA acetyltransferase family protein
MSRAPFVMPKAESAFSRSNAVYDTTIGWRFVNPRMEALYGTDSMPETGENVAEQFRVTRADQDAFALRSQEKALAAQANGRLAREIAPVTIPQRKAEPVVVDRDEHPRQTSLDKLAALPTPFRKGGTVTAGNASQQNDAAAACLVVAEDKLAELGLEPLGYLVDWASAGCHPATMGIGPVPAVQKLFARTGLTFEQMDLIELNEAFAAQALAVVKGWRQTLEALDDKLNVNGSGISLGHPIGATGVRILATMLHELKRRRGRYALETMCIGGGQGLAAVFERA